MAAPASANDSGAPAPDFELTATDGRRYRRDAVAGPNGLLVMFICNHCPYVKAALDKIVRDASALKDHGIGSVAISSNDTVDTRAQGNIVALNKIGVDSTGNSGLASR